VQVVVGCTADEMGPEYNLHSCSGVDWFRVPHGLAAGDTT
jgi:hypothetical protein